MQSGTYEHLWQKIHDIAIDNGCVLKKTGTGYSYRDPDNEKKIIFYLWSGTEKDTTNAHDTNRKPSIWVNRIRREKAKKTKHPDVVLNSSSEGFLIVKNITELNAVETLEWIFQLQQYQTKMNIREVILPEEIKDIEKFPEGGRKIITVNNYERNRKAREACIKKYGYHCAVCRTKMEDIYGDLGKGYIHVHHIVPVSKITKRYEVDPINDLRPVCPNCHAMLHVKEKITIEELKRVIKKTPYTDCSE